MRKYGLLVPIVFLVVSCSQLPIESIIPVASATSTSTITVTPSLTPTATITPTVTPSPTFTPSPVPTVPPKDIDPDNRFYIKTSLDLFNGRPVTPNILLPFGLYKNSVEPSQPDFPGVTTYILSGILLDVPIIDSEGNVIVKLGIPNKSMSDYNIIYLKNLPVTWFGDGGSIPTVHTNTIPAKMEIKHSFIPNEQFISEASYAVGRQIATYISVSNNQETLADYWQYLLENSEPCQATPNCVERVERMIEDAETTVRISKLLLNNDPQYSNQTLLVVSEYTLPLKRYEPKNDD